MQSNSSGGSSLCIQRAIFRLNSMSVAVFIPFHLGRGNSSMSPRGINTYYNPHVDSPQQREMARHTLHVSRKYRSPNNEGLLGGKARPSSDPRLHRSPVTWGQHKTLHTRRHTQGSTLLPHRRCHEHRLGPRIAASPGTEQAASARGSGGLPSPPVSFPV